eukprot:gene8412-8596_t
MSYSVGQLLPAGMQQESNLPPRSESIPALLPDQLDYIDLLISDESTQPTPRQQQHQVPSKSSISIFHKELQEVEPRIPEWNAPNSSSTLFASLEDEALSTDDSPMHSFCSSNGPSTSQLWTQRSIGATARKDLAKFAALQNMAQQHSNSSTPIQGLASTGSGLAGLISPWGSVNSAQGSSMESSSTTGQGLAVDISFVRRAPSPAGAGAQPPGAGQQPIAAHLPPLSPGSFPNAADAVAQAIQQFMAASNALPAAAAAATAGWLGGHAGAPHLPAGLFEPHGMPGPIRYCEPRAIWGPCPATTPSNDTSFSGVHGQLQHVEQPLCLATPPRAPSASACSPRPLPLDPRAGTGRGATASPLPPWQQQQPGAAGNMMMGSSSHLQALGMQGSCAEPHDAAASATVSTAAQAPSSGMAPAALALSTATLEQQSAHPRAGSAAVVTGAVSSSEALEPPMLRADGALFIRELLQLLKSGAAAGNPFLSNLRDLLECALDAHAAEEAAALLCAGNEGSCAGSAVNGGKLRVEIASQGDDANSEQAVGSALAASTKHTAVDAAAFVGILQEAAAPLLAARARAAQGLEKSTSSQMLDQQVPAQSSETAQASSTGPLMNKTTLHGCKDTGSGSCGGSGPGTPRGVPLLLGPQTVPELLYARAALITLMISAHSFVQGPAYSHMADKLEGIAELYDSMHEDPVVMKRRKCRQMELMRDDISKGAQFSQASTAWDGGGCNM